MDNDDNDLSASSAKLAALREAERARARCYRTALECTRQEALIAAWTAALGRAEAASARLDRELADTGTEDDRRDCLVEAIELAIANGDPTAAEAVARECVALAEAMAERAWREAGEAAHGILGPALPHRGAPAARERWRFRRERSRMARAVGRVALLALAPVD